MCCKSFWKKIIAITIGFLIGVFATNYAHKAIQGNSQLNDDTSLAYETNTYSLKIISMPEPNYTDIARLNKTAGVVRLRVTFSASGQIGNVTVVERLPDGLTQKAIEAAQKIQFEPSLVFGEPVTENKIVEYNFSVY